MNLATADAIGICLTALHFSANVLMRNLDGLIERATHHVAEGRRIVAAHRQRIADGRTAPGAYDWLTSFEETLALFEADLARLTAERDRHREGYSEAFPPRSGAVMRFR